MQHNIIGVQIHEYNNVLFWVWGEKTPGILFVKLGFKRGCKLELEPGFFMLLATGIRRGVQPFIFSFHVSIEDKRNKKAITGILFN